MLQEKLELYNNSYCAQTWLALRYKDGCLFLCELLAKSACTIAHNIGPYDSSAHKSPEDPQQQLKSEQHFTGEAEYRKSQGTGTNRPRYMQYEEISRYYAPLYILLFIIAMADGANEMHVVYSLHLQGRLQHIQFIHIVLI